MSEPSGAPMNHWRSAIAHYLPSLVYGANDGIVTTFVIVTGAAGAALSSEVVLILGFANLLADGFSMGTSNVLAQRSTQTADNRPSLPAASRQGIATFIAFVCAGLIPLFAFLTPISADMRFPVACVLVIFALFTVGSGRSLFSDRPWFVAGIEMLALGTVAGIVAYGVGALSATIIRSF